MARQLQHQSPDLDDFVADLTEAAYPIALRHKESDDWLDLQLGLWRVLTDAVHKWEQRITQAVCPPEPVLLEVRGGTKTVGGHPRRLSASHAS